MGVLAWVDTHSWGGLQANCLKKVENNGALEFLLFEFPKTIWSKRFDIEFEKSFEFETTPS